MAELFLAALDKKDGIGYIAVRFTPAEVADPEQRVFQTAIPVRADMTYDEMSATINKALHYNNDHPTRPYEGKVHELFYDWGMGDRCVSERGRRDVYIADRRQVGFGKASKGNEYKAYDLPHEAYIQVRDLDATIADSKDSAKAQEARKSKDAILKGHASTILQPSAGNELKVGQAYQRDELRKVGVEMPARQEKGTPRRTAMR